MTATEILFQAATRAENGIAIGVGYDGRNFCTAALLLNTARGNSESFKGERLDAYLKARRALCLTLGVSDTYDSLVEWNDAYRNTKGGIRVHYRKPKEVATMLRKAAASLIETEASK